MAHPDDRADRHGERRRQNRRHLPCSLDHRGVLQSPEVRLRLREASARELRDLEECIGDSRAHRLEDASASVSRTRSKHASVGDVANDVQVEVLREFSSRPPPAKPTVADITTAIAALGGHLTSNGPPGWHVLWRGYQELLTLERAWTAAQRRLRCDQS